MEKLITFKEFKSSPDEYKKIVQKIDRAELTFLWFNDYFDGMLEGILEYNNEKLRFEIITDYISYAPPREFAVIYLTAEQIKAEIYWHNLFKTHVGTHNSLFPAEDVGVRPDSGHHLFYDKYNKRVPPDYSANIMRGWYVED